MDERTSIEPSVALATDPASGQGQEIPKVLYVMGAGRSGSTILGITLGNCSDIFYAGELDKWLRLSGKPRQGGGEDRERFWRLVHDELDVPPVLLDEAACRLEQSSALPLRLKAWRAQHRMRHAYRRLAGDLYRVIARTAGVTHVVDTSHYPRRARQLQKVDGIDLYLLFLVRDPQSVVASWNRQIDGSRASGKAADVVQPGFRIRTANAYLWLTHLLSLYVFLRHPRDRRLLVRHESLVADPNGVLRDILDCAGSSAPMPDFAALETGMIFQGNRVASSSTVSLSPHASRTPRRSLLTAILQMPWKVVFAGLRPVAGARAGSAYNGKPQPAQHRPGDSQQTEPGLHRRV